MAQVSGQSWGQAARTTWLGSSAFIRRSCHSAQALGLEGRHPAHTGPHTASRTASGKRRRLCRDRVGFVPSSGKRMAAELLARIELDGAPACLGGIDDNQEEAITSSMHTRWSNKDPIVSMEY
jgi:hypothetical protein